MLPRVVDTLLVGSPPAAGSGWAGVCAIAADNINMQGKVAAAVNRPFNLKVIIRLVQSTAPASPAGDGSFSSAMMPLRINHSTSNPGKAMKKVNTKNAGQP